MYLIHEILHQDDKNFRFINVIKLCKVIKTFIEIHAIYIIVKLKIIKKSLIKYLNNFKIL